MIEITNTTSQRIPRQFILDICKDIFQYLKIKYVTLSVVFVMPVTIKKLNLLYRYKNKITDVLSFSYKYNQDILDGEIIICYKVALCQAKHFQYSFRQEIKKLLVHSILHLIGYDHQSPVQIKKMEQLENNIIQHLIKKI